MIQITRNVAPAMKPGITKTGIFSSFFLPCFISLLFIFDLIFWGSPDQI
uniref:Transmembrane protein n=1 Tax=Arabidopsis thaliana TaxID=3702 RepID=Q0WTB9_ARATH|nr:hypothetical protein [Arabidopsis thaliana]